MRIKILAVMATLLSMTNVVMAQGLYLGIDAGIADLLNKESHSINPESHQLSKIGPTAGTYLGYAFDLNEQFYIAAEVFIDGTWVQTKIQHAGSIYTQKQFYNLGMRFLPAYAFTTDTFGHIILGYTNARTEIEDYGVYGLVNSIYSTGGFQAGIGFDTALMDNFFIRLDALYNIYRSNTMSGLSLQRYTNRFSQLEGEVSIFYKWIC